MRSISEIVDGVTLTSVRGRVMATQVWSETHVKGSGSGVMVKGVGVGSSKTTSTVVNKREVCIVAEDGLQIVEEFNADAVQLMPDQEVTLIRAAKSATAEPVTVGIHNHGTRKSGLTGKDMFPVVSFLLKASFFVTFFGLVVMGMGAGARNPNGPLLIGGLLILGNLYWFRGYPILKGFERRVQEAMGTVAADKVVQHAALRTA